MITDDLETLLKAKEASNYNIVETIKEQKVPRLVADKSASLDDMMVMISELVSKTMKKQKVEFKPDEGVRLSVDQAEKLEHPYIFYKILNCDPLKELKPRVRESILERDIDEKDARPGEVYGQLFRCNVQFDILGRDYKEVQAVMNSFEDLIFSYTAYLKRNGVAEIIFTRRLTDSNLDLYRQKCSVRSIQYYVEIEKLFTFYQTEISDITVS